MIESNPGAEQGGMNILARMYKNHLKNTRHLMKNKWGYCLVERLGLCTLFLEVVRIVQTYGFKLYLIGLLCWSCINLPLRTLTLPPKNYKTSFNLLQNCMHDWTIDFLQARATALKAGPMWGVGDWWCTDCTCCFALWTGRGIRKSHLGIPRSDLDSHHQYYRLRGYQTGELKYIIKDKATHTIIHN